MRVLAMKLFIKTILLACLSGSAVAQCSAGGSGTNCNGPLTFVPPPGNTVQSGIVFIDLGLPSAAPEPGHFNISILGGILQESDNGAPYHSLVGPAGPRGLRGWPGRDGIDGQNGQGVPPGGTLGQILMKESAANYDTAWVNRPGTMPFDYTFRYASGSVLVAPGTHELGFARNWIDMSGVSQIRLVVTSGLRVLPAGSYAQAQYRSTVDGQWYALSGQAPLVDGADAYSSGWAAIPPGAIGDYVVRVVVFNSGTDAAPVGLQQEHLQFK
jgi:hypothetical protein